MMTKPKGATSRQKSKRIELAKLLIERRYAFSDIIGALVKKFNVSERTAMRDYSTAKEQVAARGSASYPEQKAEILSTLDHLLAEHRTNPDMQVKLMNQRIRLLELDAKYGPLQERKTPHAHDAEDHGSAGELAEFLRLFETKPETDESRSD